MKKIIITLGLLISQLNSQSQQFLNGNFNLIDYQLYCSQENYETGYGLNWYDPTFPENPWWGNVKYVNIGCGGDSTIYPLIGYSESGIFYDVLSLELTQPLTIGEKYKITFDEKANLDIPLTFETTNEPGEYGQEIYTFFSTSLYLDDWRENSFEFIAQDSSQFINVYINLNFGIDYYYTQRALDNFNIESVIEEPVLSIQENTLNTQLQFNVFSIDGKKLFTNASINDLHSGIYILENNNQFFKIIK
jgi:hypothetical protein